MTDIEPEPAAAPMPPDQWRMPPCDLGAEMNLLGSLIVSGGDAVLYAKVAAIVDRLDFFQADHQLIYDALIDLRQRRRAIDAVTLLDALDKRGVRDDVGGAGYLGRILGSVISAAHAEHYAHIVHALAVKRGLIALGSRAVRAGYEAHQDEDVTAALSALSRDAAALSTSGKAQLVHRLGDVAAEVVGAAGGGRSSQLLRTGLSDLDRVIGGLPLGGHTLIAGKPGMGKSMLAKQVLLNLSARDPVGIVSVEETRHKIAENALANRAGVINARIHHGTASADDWRRLADAAGELQHAPIYVVDSAATLPAILAMVELLALRHGCRAIVVDHVHIIDGQPGRHENREREVSRISAGLKFAWKQLGVAGVCCAQLNRAGGRERPTLSSLRDSGSLEQDGDVVLLLHRDDYYRKQDATHDAPAQLDGMLDVIVAKNKSGGTGTVQMSMDESLQRVADRWTAQANAFGDAVPAAVTDTFDGMGDDR